ncbi:MAG TPA: hypothetical protein VFN48_05495 [Solirubrobacteraceae bacterium]|nr:hypothetical protein [Solirubrobacteraceae bacterium]
MPAADSLSALSARLEWARGVAREHPALTDLGVAVILTLVVHALLGGTANVLLALLLLALLTGALLALRRRRDRRRRLVRPPRSERSRAQARAGASAPTWRSSGPG